MAKLAHELWPKYMGNASKPTDSLKLIRAVIDKISLKHVNRDSFQLAIEKQIPELTEFVKQKDLIYLDPVKTSCGTQGTCVYGWRGWRFHICTRSVR